MRDADARSRNAEITRRSREKHPDRARDVAKRNNARASAGLKLAAMYPDEFEALYVAECAKRGVPLYPEPLPRDLDGRRPTSRRAAAHTKADDE